MPSGEEKAWKTLSQLTPEDVCSRAKATFDELCGVYLVKSFLQDILVSPKDEKMLGRSPTGDFILNEIGHLSRLSILWYLINAKDIPLSKKLVGPADMTGGQIFLKGSHALPLNQIAEKYGSDILGFFRRGRQLGGKELDYGDASLRLLPFPRVPVSILLWKGDVEFPAHCGLLFDSTCEVHLPADIIWSTAMMSVLIML